MRYAKPNTPGSKVQYRTRYDNFIGGDYVRPKLERYFENISPVNGKPFCEVARSSAEDVELALDAAHGAKAAWGKTSVADRSAALLKIADAMEANLEMLAVSETWDNGKPVRETLAADLPLAIDHFRYFAGCLRAEEGSMAELDANTVSYHLKEPLGVVGQIIPWNFPLLMAAWKLAPALAAGNSGRPSRPRRRSCCSPSGEVLLPGVLDASTAGIEAPAAAGVEPRISRCHGTTTGRLIMQYASENLIPVTLELGGKSPNIFFADVLAQDDDFRQKALEGFGMFALNQGEVCTCPSRALVDKKIYGQFLELAVMRAAASKPGDPLDPTPASAPRPPTISSRRSSATSTSASRRARGSAWAASGSTSAATWPAATTSRRPSSRATTRCACSRKRSSARWSRSPRSTASTTPSPRPTTRSTAWVPASGPATSTPPSAPAAPSRPAASGPTATTSTPPTPPSAATSSPASAARPTR
jgi:acyl-CoA reductase-like NAD-dependent aldehyde dehydrogenase